MSKPVKLLQTVLSLLLTTAALTFFVLAVLAALGRIDHRAAVITFGIMMLVAGAREIGGAVVADWRREWWEPAPGGLWVEAGRLSSLGSGLLIGSFGVLLMGTGQAPQFVQLAAAVVMLVGLGIALVGQSQDRRRAEAAVRHGVPCRDLQK